MTSLASTMLTVSIPVITLAMGVICSCIDRHGWVQVIGWLLVAMSLSVWLFETVALFVFTSGVGAAPLITFWLLVFG